MDKPEYLRWIVEEEAVNKNFDKRLKNNICRFLMAQLFGINFLKPCAIH